MLISVGNYTNVAVFNAVDNDVYKQPNNHTVLTQHGASQCRIILDSPTKLGRTTVNTLCLDQVMNLSRVKVI